MGYTFDMSLKTHEKTEFIDSMFDFSEDYDPFERDGKTLHDGKQITFRQIEHALNGEVFQCAVSVRATEKCTPCDPRTFMYYYRVFARCERFGLPQGKGWLEEPDWILDIFDVFKSVKTFYENRPR